MVHGGLSPSIQSIDQIRAIDRVVEVDSISFVVVVVWSGVEWSGVEWSGVEWSGVHCSLLVLTLLLHFTPFPILIPCIHSAYI